jgi:hypothetical protein
LSELEPVAAGDPIARPVVKILVRHHGLDADEIGVGRGPGPGQHIFRIENVQAFVFHRAVIEVRDRHDHEAVEVIFQAEPVLVPLHRALEGGHGVVALVDVLGLGIDLEQHVAAGAGRKVVLEAGEVARHQREQIRGFGKRIVPDREMAASCQLALLDQVAVAKQHRVLFPVRLDPRAIDRHHVRPVGKPGDAAEALRLALGAEDAVREVEALERGVRVRPRPAGDLELESGRRRVDRQVLVALAVAVGAERLAVEPDADQLELLAVEHQRRQPVAGGRIAPDGKPRRHLGRGRVEADVEIDPVDQIVRHPVVLQKDRLGRAGIGHRASFASFATRGWGLTDSCRRRQAWRVRRIG